MSTNKKQRNIYASMPATAVNVGDKKQNLTLIIDNTKEDFYLYTNFDSVEAIKRRSR